MVRSNVAMQVPNKVFVILDRNFTENKQESIGRETKFLLTRPDCIFFVDEFGCNSLQKSDGNVSGHKFVVGNKARALIRSSHQDCHFSVLGFTNAVSEPVCCIIFIAAAKVRAKDIMGLQP